MTVVTYRPTRRAKTKRSTVSQPCKITGSTIITTKQSRKRRYDRTPDPEVDERVRAFFAKMGLALPEEQK